MKIEYRVITPDGRPVEGLEPWRVYNAVMRTVELQPDNSPGGEDTLVITAVYNPDGCWYTTKWTDEVGDIDVCVNHNQNSKYAEGLDRPCLAIDPWTEPNG